MLGKVESYSSKKGYGFIAGDDGRKYFVPYCNVRTRSGELIRGYQVEFNTEKIGNRAYNVRYI